MGLVIEYIDGQTPLDEDEKVGLLIKTISTREELNQFEQVNIQQAVEWSLKNKFTAEEILTESFIRKVHKLMFGEVWSWAGSFRKSNKNIGSDKYQISTNLRTLLDDTRFWLDNKSFKGDEIAIRFSHRLVQIHLFPNGNGRHSRLMADIFITNIFKEPPFSWGGADLADKGEKRKAYLQAIYSADAGDIAPLLIFARSQEER